MMVAARIFALLFRLCFFALSTWGLMALLTGKGEPESAHARIVGAIFCLFVSCGLSHGSLRVALLLLACFAALMGCDIFFARKTGKGGQLFLPAALLSAIGASVSFDAMGDSATSHIIRLCLFSAVCVATVVLARRYDHWLAASFALFLGVTVVLCALPLVPGLGISANGSTAWVGIGGRALGQPSEFAKVTLAVSLAGYLAANVDRLSSFSLRGIAPLMLIFLLALGTEWMVKDIGTAMVLFAAVAAMVMISSRRAGVVYALIAAVGVTAMLVFAYHNFSHVAQRFDAWLSPEGTYSGDHLLKAASAMANGGLIGTGLGMEHASWRVFAIDTDAIYAIIVEELGLAGAVQVLGAIVALAVVTARTARNLPRESFERNLLNTASVLVCVQAFIIVAGITRVIPLTGVTLPFVSRGGSSLLSCFLLMGVMGAAGASGKYAEARHNASSLAVPVFCTVGFSACLAMTALIVVGTGGLRLCGLTEHYRMGDVSSSDGQLLAKSEQVGHTISYTFPNQTHAAHMLGVYSGGITSVLRKDPFLTRASNPVLNLLGIPETLGETTLTIESGIQAVAEQQLEGQVGAIVAMDARTGAILAEASSPTYDPNLDVLDSEDPTVSAFNRATQSQYAPGSTFKIVTAAAALEGGYATPQTMLDGNTLTLSRGEHINNFGNIDYGQISLTTALVQSSNTAFTDLALRMGDDVIRDRAEAFGFNQDPQDKVQETRMSVYGPAMSEYALALSSFGQPISVDGVSCGPQVTVLQMAQVIAAVSNGGIRMKPYLVRQGQIGKGPLGAEVRPAMSAIYAQQLWEMLVQSSHVAGARVEVGGKTGTAEMSGSNVCWYVCAADGVAVACCIEGTLDLGYRVALPRAMAVLDAAVGLGNYYVL